MSWSIEQDRRAAVDDLAQVAAEHDRLLRVEPGGRLVEAEQLRAGRQCSGDGDELALALGELGGRRLGEVAEAEHLERLVDGVGAGDRSGEQVLERRHRPTGGARRP